MSSLLFTTRNPLAASVSVRGHPTRGKMSVWAEVKGFPTSTVSATLVSASACFIMSIGNGRDGGSELSVRAKFITEYEGV